MTLNTTPSTWDGSVTQDELMEKDHVILLDDDDNVIGSASKKKAHEFSLDKPHGMLHRAFSVFLFDEDGNLLLQKRASTKITFPNVWTNTCCSHPLHCMTPREVDTSAEVKSGEVPGVKHAAIRKLYHELGIPMNQIPIEKFKFLTRFHYWAADIKTHGPKSIWGEHEIDYILIAQVRRASITLNPNPEEVDDIMWVSNEKLKIAMQQGLWSPWFCIIYEKFLISWWTRLKDVLNSNLLDDWDQIHEFDPPLEYMGGKGNASSLFHNK